MNGRWATPGARSDANFNWDVVQLPTGPGGTQGNWLFWGAYVVNANTEHPAGSVRTREGADHGRDAGIDQRTRRQHPEP